MEVYFKELISKESSLEKLVDDLMLLVYGVEDLARAKGIDLDEPTRTELVSGLERLGESCRAIKAQAAAGAVATDRIVRRNPYYSASIAFGVGVLLGAFLGRKK